MATLRTSDRTFANANIKGNPRMPDTAVLSDLHKVAKNADIAGLQEFNFRSYWRMLRRAMPRKRWATHPRTFAFSRSAQPIVWRTNLVSVARRRQRLLHRGVKGVTENRYITAALLVDADTRLACWYVSSHFVVHGDQPGDEARRRAIFTQDERRTARFLARLVRTGYPVVFGLDANTRRTDWLPKKIGGQAVHFHGARGIEFTVTINGTNGTRVAVVEHETIPVRRLHTDHETRLLTHRLVGPSAAARP